MSTLINISGGNLHLESIGIYLSPGARLEFDNIDELLVRSPEVTLYLERGRVLITEPTQESPREN